MKLSSYGMYEKSRLDLVTALLHDQQLKLNREELNAALLGPVITTIIETAFNHQQKLIEKKSTLTIKERALETNKISFATMLPTLAYSLNINEDLLKSHVEKFVYKAWEIYHTNADYLMTLATISKETQTTEMANLYGETFAITYPDLSKLLPYNDSQILQEATKKVEKAIRDKCPLNLQEQMLQHIEYMNEISMQRTATLQFAENFKIQTGITMEQFKTKMKFIHYTTANTTVTDVSHFKSQQQSETSISPDTHTLSTSNVTKHF